MGACFSPAGKILHANAVSGPTEWDAYLAEVAAKTGASEEQLAWLIQDSAEREDLQWERLNEIRRLGT